jgi:hypothetical protein
MNEETPVAAPPTRIFKVGLSVPSQDHVSYCVGLGVGPSEDQFREWLHRRILLSQLPFLWAQVDPLQVDAAGELERLMHLIAYASGCSPFRQLFWSGEEVTLPDSSELFLQGVATGAASVPGGSCALLLAGKAISDLRLAGPFQVPDRKNQSAAPPTRRAEPSRAAAKAAPPPWFAGLMTAMGFMRKKLAYLWMTW